MFKKRDTMQRIMRWVFLLLGLFLSFSVNAQSRPHLSNCSQPRLNGSQLRDPELLVQLESFSTLARLSPPSEALQFQWIQSSEQISRMILDRMVSDPESYSQALYWVDCHSSLNAFAFGVLAQMLQMKWQLLDGGGREWSRRLQRLGQRNAERFGPTTQLGMALLDSFEMLSSLRNPTGVSLAFKVIRTVAPPIFFWAAGSPDERSALHSRLQQQSQNIAYPPAFYIRLGEVADSRIHDEDVARLFQQYNSEILSAVGAFAINRAVVVPSAIKVMQWLRVAGAASQLNPYSVMAQMTVFYLLDTAISIELEDYYSRQRIQSLDQNFLREFQTVRQVLREQDQNPTRTQSNQELAQNYFAFSRLVDATRIRTQWGVLLPVVRALRESPESFTSSRLTRVHAYRVLNQLQRQGARTFTPDWETLTLEFSRKELLNQNTDPSGLNSTDVVYSPEEQLIKQFYLKQLQRAVARNDRAVARNNRAVARNNRAVARNQQSNTISRSFTPLLQPQTFFYSLHEQTRKRLEKEFIESSPEQITSVPATRLLAMLYSVSGSMPLGRSFKPMLLDFQDRLSEEFYRCFSGISQDLIPVFIQTRNQQETLQCY